MRGCRSLAGRDCQWDAAVGQQPPGALRVRVRLRGLVPLSGPQAPNGMPAGKFNNLPVKTSLTQAGPPVPLVGTASGIWRMGSF